VYPFGTREQGDYREGAIAVPDPCRALSVRGSRSRGLTCDGGLGEAPGPARCRASRLPGAGQAGDASDLAEPRRPLPKRPRPRYRV